MIKNQFQEFQISQELIESLNVLGYLEPTDIQKEVIPEALKKCDIVAKSQTGSGKTAAFGIPLCEMAVWEENLPGALVLEPTRELTVQVKQELFRIGRYKRLKVADLFGGFPIDKQVQTLRQKNHIAVGTPGRVMDHIRRESLITDQIKYLIIDEADLMLDMGFIDEVEAIMKALPKDVSIMLFSATIGDGLERLIRKYMKDPVFILIEAATETVSQVEQVLYEVDADSKYEAFLSLLIQENPDSAMIFCGTREMVNVLCRRLGKDDVRCGMIHGEIDQQDRLRTIEGFSQGRFHFLIATDVAARGIDFDNLTHVFNYDFPTGREAYVHRIGRTARNGKTGRAVSLVRDMDKKMLGMVEDYIHFLIPRAA
ncbi:MAG: DEAD/DEAH box helicase, partial [Clostridiales bacterium]|nr:DEAD/DEAH box helicase [Clostridiales bacterium]